MRDYGLNAGLGPERIGIGIEEGKEISPGPSVGENKIYGLEGGSSPDRVGQELEGSCGIQDGPAGGAKAFLTSVQGIEDKEVGITLAVNDEMNRGESIVVSAVKKKSQKCHKTDALSDTLLPSETSQACSVEKLPYSYTKPSDEGLTTKGNITEAYGSVESIEHLHAVKHVCILAEAVPTWLAVADGWKTEQIEIFMDQPERGRWFIDGLGVKNKVSILPTVVGVR